MDREVPASKKCCRCGDTLPLTATYWYRNRRSKDGWKPACKACNRSYQQMQRKANPWPASISNMVKNARTRAHRLGLPFDLTKQWVEENLPEKCPILGFRLQAGDSTPRGLSPSIDRMDPEKGYTQDNCNIISMRANAIKSDGTPDEVMAVAVWLQRQKEAYWHG